MKKEEKILVLHQKAKWYEMIERGEKLEKYRDDKEYWRKRLDGKKYDFVKFAYGYTKRTMMYEVKSIDKSIGRIEWGAEANKIYYRIRIGNRIYK